MYFQWFWILCGRFRNILQFGKFGTISFSWNKNDSCIQADYITRNKHQHSEYETHFYYEKYGKYTNSIDREKPHV